MHIHPKWSTIPRKLKQQKEKKKKALIFFKRSRLTQFVAIVTELHFSSTALSSGATDRAWEPSEGSSAFFTPRLTHHNRVLVLVGTNRTIHPHRVLRGDANRLTAQLKENQEAELESHMSGVIEGKIKRRKHLVGPTETMVACQSRLLPPFYLGKSHH